MTHGLLFDTTPSAPLKDAKRKSPNRKKVVVADEQGPAGNSWRTLPATLGTLDGHYECVDDTCGADAMDILDERDRMWLLECCFCGTRSWFRSVSGVLTPPDGRAFRLRGGRFDGLTFAEVSMDPMGPEYIEWAANGHPRPSVRTAAQTWLAENPSTC